ARGSRERMSDIAAVIGNFNGERYLADCIASLQAQDHAPTEVVVVDGGSTDGGVELAARLGARVVARPNLGLGHLYNVGVAATTAAHVFLANNDIALEPDCLGRLSRALDDDERAFATDARQLDWSGERTI